MRIVCILYVGCASILFNACKPTDRCRNKLLCERLDSIEAQMFQRPENLENLLSKLDTTNITPYERARMSSIKGMSLFEKGEIDKSIKELEKAETFFISKGDQFHTHINKLIRAFSFETTCPQRPGG